MCDRAALDGRRASPSRAASVKLQVCEGLWMRRRMFTLMVRSRPQCEQTKSPGATRGCLGMPVLTAVVSLMKILPMRPWPWPNLEMWRSTLPSPPACSDVRCADTKYTKAPRHHTGELGTAGAKSPLSLMADAWSTPRRFVFLVHVIVEVFR